MATLKNIILYRNNVPIGYLGSNGNPIRTARWANSINNTYINVSNIPNLYAQNNSHTSYYEFGDIPPVIRFEGFTGYYGSTKIRTVAEISELNCNRTTAYYPEEQTLSFNGISARQSINVRTYSDTNYSIYTVSGKINQYNDAFIKDSLYKVNKPQYFYWDAGIYAGITMLRTLLFPENNSYDQNYATTYSEKFFSFGTAAAETSCYVSYNNTNYTSQALQFNLNVGESVSVSVIPCFVNTTFKNASLTTWISTYNLNVTYTCTKNNNNVSVTTYNGILTIKGVTPGTTKITKVGINDIYGVYGDNLLCKSSSITTNITITVASLNSSISQANITKTYGDAAFTITPSRTGVSSLTWSLSKTGVVSLSATKGNSVTATIQGAGTVTVTLSGTASSGYNAPANKTFTIRVNRKAHTITFSPTTKTVTYGDKTVYKVSVTSTIPTGTSISWASNNSSVAKITAGSTTSEVSIQPRNAGTARVTPTVTNSNYSFTISSQYHTLTVNKANATIYAPANINAYIGSYFSINTYTTPSGQYEISSYYNSGYVLIPSSGTNVSNQYYLGIGGTGACYFTAPNIINTFTVKFRSYLNSNNYNETGFVTTNVTIIKYNSGITYGSLPSNPVWGNKYTISYSLTGSTNVTVTTSVKRGSASVSTSSGKCYINASAPGWTYVQLTNPGNGTHYSSSTTIKIYFNKRSSSIVVPASSTYYGADLPTAYNGSTNRPYATIPISMTPGITTTNLNFTYSYNNTTYYSGYSYGNSNSFSCVYLYATAPGTYNGYLWFNGDNYYNATNASFTVTFNKKAAAVTTSLSSIAVTYDGASGSFTVSRTGNGSLVVSKNNNNITSLKLSSGTVTFAPAAAGTSTINVKTNESTWWLAASKSVSVTVNKQNLKVRTWARINYTSNTITQTNVSNIDVYGAFANNVHVGFDLYSAGNSGASVSYYNNSLGGNQRSYYTSYNGNTTPISFNDSSKTGYVSTTGLNSGPTNNYVVLQFNRPTNLGTSYLENGSFNINHGNQNYNNHTIPPVTIKWIPFGLAAYANIYSISTYVGVTKSVSFTHNMSRSFVAALDNNCYYFAHSPNKPGINLTYSGSNNQNLSLVATNAYDYIIYSNVTSNTEWLNSSSVIQITVSVKKANTKYSNTIGAGISKTFLDGKFSVTGVKVINSETGANNAVITTNNSHINWTSSNTSVATISTAGEITIVGAGKTNITSYYPSNGRYNQSNTVTNTLTVSQKQITLNALTNMSFTFGDAAKTQTASWSPAVGTLYATSNNTGVCTVSVNGSTITVTPKNSGTATITCYVAAPNGNYIKSANKTFTVTVNDKGTSITTPSKITVTYYPNGNVSMSTTKSTGVGTLTWTPQTANIFNESSLTGNSVTFTMKNSTYTLTGNQVAIKISGAKTTNYAKPADVTFYVTINRYQTVITQPSNITKTYEDGQFSVTPTLSIGLTAANMKWTLSPASGTYVTASGTAGASNTFTIVKSGTTTVTLSFTSTSNDNNYIVPANKSFTITVNKRNTTITNPGNKTCTYADNTISVSTTKRTGVGTLTWTPATTAVISPTKTGDSVTFNINDVGSSNVTITGVPSDSTKYNTPPAQTFSITVNKGATSLSTKITSSTVWLYHPSNSKTVTISTTLTSTPVNRITASDIALITWSSSNTNIATVSSSTGGSVTVTAVKGGTCTIKCKFPGTTKFNASSEVSVSITVNEYHPYTLSLSYSGITVNGKYINTAETNSITIAVSPSYLLAAIGNSISASSGTTTVVSTLTKTLTNSNTKCNYACTITANAGVSKITIKTTDLWNGNSFHPGTSTTVYITNLNEIKPSGTRAIRIANNNYLSQQYSVTVSSNNNANYCPTKSQINGLSLIRVMDNILTDNQLVPESYIYKIVTDNNFYSGNNYTPVYTTK